MTLTILVSIEPAIKPECGREGRIVEHTVDLVSIEPAIKPECGA